MKVIGLFICAMLLSACNTHAPEPAKAKGDWYELNTTIQQIKAGTI